MRKITLFSLLLSFKVLAHTLHYVPVAPLKIITIGHPTLKMIAKSVPHDQIDTDEIQTLIDNMIDTMAKAGGVGIAAPQVNVSKRIFIIKPNMFKKAEAIINPTVEYIKEAGKKSSSEGCLSIPGKTFKVKRYKEINFSYFNRDGKWMVERATGFRAIVAQHEYDHLNGIMISDFLLPEYISADELEFDVPRM
jgi:peptide deformylase